MTHNDLTMNDEDALLLAMISQPEESAPRLVYADWLQERKDPRADLLRWDWDTPRLSFVDWVAGWGKLKYYLQKFPELHEQKNQHDANSQWRAALSQPIFAEDQDWLALIDSLPRPFQSFYFWNNTGPRSFLEGELPFLEPIGTRGSVVTFASSFRVTGCRQQGLAQDLRLLIQSNWGECEMGAASCPVHPFICEFESKQSVTGADILRALKASDFRSEHIPSLNETKLAYSGYHPGTENDEIHNDSDRQHLFLRPEDEAGLAPSEDDRRQSYKALREAVLDNRLWYVLLHSRAELPADDVMGRRSYVMLFAVGKSLRGDRPIGVVSHQMCHNLCD